MKIKISNEMYEISGADDKALKTILTVISKVLESKDKMTAIKDGLSVINATVAEIPTEMEL